MATCTLSAQHHDPCLHLHSYDLLQVDTGSLNMPTRRALPSHHNTALPPLGRAPRPDVMQRVYMLQCAAELASRSSKCSVPQIGIFVLLAGEGFENLVER